MATLLNRAWQFSVGLAGVPGLSFGTELLPPGGRAPQIVFEVTKTPRRGANKATFKLYNLNPITIGLLETIGATITFVAGYRGAGIAAGNQGLIFIGTVARRGVTTAREGANRVTTVEAGDAELNIQQARSDISLAPGSTTTLAIQQLLLKLAISPTGIPLAPIGPGNTGLLPPLPFATGWAHFGFARDALTEIADMYDATWSVQDGQLYIVRSGEQIPGQAVLLSPQTGLIGIPRKTKEGIEAVSLLQPTLTPGGVVSVVSETEQGFYNVREVTHKGGFRDSDWYTSLKGRTLELAP